MDVKLITAIFPRDKLEAVEKTTGQLEHELRGGTVRYFRKGFHSDRARVQISLIEGFNEEG